MALALAGGRSVFDRYVVRTLIVAAALIAALFAVTYWTASSGVTRSLRLAVDTDLAGLVDIYAAGGTDELVLRIDDREQFASADGRTALYLLADGRGQRIAGAIAEWPALSAPVSEAGYVRVAPGDVRVFARATQLGPDLRLVVARRYEPDAAMLRRLSLLFGLTGLGAVIIVALLGRMAAGRLRRRVEAINAAYRDLDPSAEAAASVAAYGDADEIAELARHSDTALIRLQRLVQTQKEVTNQIAHEIRTPLMHIDQKAIAALRDDDPARMKTALVAVRGDVKRVANLLDSLLDIASTSARLGDPAGLSEVDLSALFASLADLYQDSMEEAGLAFTADIATDVRARVDAGQISRLVTNLLDNAVKYVPAGGAVSLFLDRGPRIVVADTGPGVAEADRMRIFDRFQRGANAIGSEGHGLGLALVRAIAERHGLVARVEDAGPGARFVIEPKESA